MANLLQHVVLKKEKKRFNFLLIVQLNVAIFACYPMQVLISKQSSVIIKKILPVNK
jgi:hypothetical protein